VSVAIDVVVLGDHHAVEAELVALVARALPGVPELEGRWYWDSRPDVAVVARAGSDVVGVRFAVSRAVVVGGAAARIVGTGIAVDPGWQKRGIGTALTKALLERVVAADDDAVVAFLATENARPLLSRFGFSPLSVSVTSRDGAGATVAEAAPCWVKELRAGFVADVVKAGEFCVGRGSF
jgi:isovaleryl-CoA dehydrogenase